MRIPLRTSLVRIAAAALFTSSLPLLHAGSNILPNGDLKEAIENLPVGWAYGPATDKEVPPDATYNYGKDPTDPKHKHAVSIVYRAGDARAIWKHGVVSTEVAKKLKPGKKYEFSLWVRWDLKNPPPKGKSPVTARWNIWGSDFEGIAAPLLTPAGSYDQVANSDPNIKPENLYQQKEIPQKSGWVQMKVIYQIPKNPIYAIAISSVYVALDAPGELWADDFKLVEVPDSTLVTLK